MSRAMLLLGLASAAVCCGCSYDPGPANPSSLACAGDPTRPLSAAAVMRVLHRHRFTVLPEPPDRANVICGGLGSRSEEMPVTLTNILSSGPHENTESHEEIGLRQGHVICGLRRGPIWGPELRSDLDAPASSPVFSGRKAEFTVANLECTIYPRGPRTEVQVRNFQRAMRVLARRVS